MLYRTSTTTRRRRDPHGGARGCRRLQLHVNVSIVWTCNRGARCGIRLRSSPFVPFSRRSSRSSLTSRSRSLKCNQPWFRALESRETGLLTEHQGCASGPACRDAPDHSHGHGGARPSVASSHPACYAGGWESDGAVISATCLGRDRCDQTATKRTAEYEPT